MAFDSVKEVLKAEETADGKVREAAAFAARNIEDEKRALSSMLESETQRAKAEAAKAIADAESKAKAEAAALMESTANKCAIMSVKAENKFDKASELIIGKVVKG